MTPLFNLYGNPDEGVATNTMFTDDDIIAAKKDALLELQEKIATTEIISPQELPNSDLYTYCDSRIKKICQDFMAGDTMEDRKVRQLMHENSDEFKCRALKYLYDTSSMELLRIIEDNQLDQTQFINCLRMVHHFEMPSSSTLTEKEEANTSSALIQKVKDHPYLSIAALIVAIKLAKKVL
jgi:hypothetical protein